MPRKQSIEHIESILQRYTWFYLISFIPRPAPRRFNVKRDNKQAKLKKDLPKAWHCMGKENKKKKNKRIQLQATLLIISFNSFSVKKSLESNKSFRKFTRHNSFSSIGKYFTPFFSQSKILSTLFFQQIFLMFIAK